jgi:hypothetical protein
MSSKCSQSLLCLLQERNEGRISLICQYQTKNPSQCQRRVSQFGHHRQLWKRKMLLATHSCELLCNNDDALLSHEQQRKCHVHSSFSDHCWRKYCYRQIPFTVLGTPTNDAVLAIDPSGSYVICLGGYLPQLQEVGDDHPSMSSISTNFVLDQQSLALRFYGVPSPSKLQTNQISSSTNICDYYSAPLLLTVPISYGINHDNNPFSQQDRNNLIDWELDIVAPPPALTPTRVWVSTDGCIGLVVARLWHHEGWIGVSSSNLRKDCLIYLIFPFLNSFA